MRDVVPRPLAARRGFPLATVGGFAVESWVAVLGRVGLPANRGRGGATGRFHVCRPDPRRRSGRAPVVARRGPAQRGIPRRVDLRGNADARWQGCILDGERRRPARASLLDARRNRALSRPGRRLERLRTRGESRSRRQCSRQRSGSRHTPHAVLGLAGQVTRSLKPEPRPRLGGMELGVSASTSSLVRGKCPALVGRVSCGGVDRGRRAIATHGGPQGRTTRCGSSGKSSPSASINMQRSLSRCGGRLTTTANANGARPCLATLCGSVLALLGNFAGTSEAAPSRRQRHRADQQRLVGAAHTETPLWTDGKPGNANKPMILRAVGSLRCGFAGPR